LLCSLDKDIDKKKLYTEPKRWTKYEEAYVVPEGQTLRRFAKASIETALNGLSVTDYTKVSNWAETYVKEVLSAHVFNGTSATTILPKSNLTYAEEAQAIKNLLVESKLINK